MSLARTRPHPPTGFTLIGALYFYFYREVGGGGGGRGDSWVWRVEIGSKGGGSAKILVILGIGRMPKIFYVDWELGKKYVNGEGFV